MSWRTPPTTPALLYGFFQFWRLNPNTGRLERSDSEHEDNMV